MDRSEIRSKIFMALGTASMCWVPPTGNAEFDSDEAVKVGEKLFSEIEEYYATNETRRCIDRLSILVQDRIVPVDPAMVIGKLITVDKAIVWRIDELERQLREAIGIIDDYLNAGNKFERSIAADKGKVAYENYHGKFYKNRNERK